MSLRGGQELSAVVIPSNSNVITSPKGVVISNDNNVITSERSERSNLIQSSYNEIATVAFGSLAMTNSMSLRGGQELSDVVILSNSNVITSPKGVVISNNNNGIATHSLAMTKNNGTPTGFAAEIDPNNIGDTLTGTNHVTYSSTDPGTSTGHIDITNPDGSTQIIYYTYTKPSDYTVTSERINNNVTVDNVNKKVFADILSDVSRGGAIYNDRNLSTTDIKSDFINNSVNSYGGAISNSSSNSSASYSLNSIIGDFIGNSSGEYGGAIYNTNYNMTIKIITGDFIGNSASRDGGAIINSNSKITTITGNFIGNSAGRNSGAIYNYGTITTITGNFIGNSSLGTDSYSGGGAIYNYGTITTLTGDFINNSSNTVGGAILNTPESKLNLVAKDGKDVIFIGNTANGQSNAIANTTGKAPWNTKYAGVINLNAANESSIIVNDGINAPIYNVSGYTAMGNTPEIHINKTGLDGVDDSTIGGNYEFNNKVENNSIFIYNGAKLKLGTNTQGENIYYGVIDNREYNGVFQNDTMGGMLDTINNHIDTQTFGSLVLNSNLNMNVDVDLQKEEMDRLSAGAYTFNNDAKVVVTGMNLLNDAEKDNTKILFAEEGLANNVDTTVKTVSYSPIYKYDVNYVVDENDNQGYFTFARSASGGSEDFNPAVIESPVAIQAGAMATMQNTFNYSFASSDSIMDMPSAERTALINRNKYAIENSSLVEGTNPLYQPVDTSTVWFKPYASFENVPLDNGPAVRTISYGTLVGYDTDLKELKKGWARNWTGYVGYNGASMSYSNVDTYQNGGLIGGTLSLYKGKFFNATTISTGATVGESHTMYGHENNTSLLAGIGNKTGYNFEFKDGRYIIQPNIFIGYTFVKTFDFKNAAGVNIESKPFNNLQLSPGVKFIMNTKKGWQPYVGVNMVWNVLNKSDVTANGVHLPNMSVRPYIQYGVGVQKKVKDNFTAYGQAMVQNGGRNGVSLTFGFRWAIGLDKKSVEKVHKPNKPDITPKITNAQFVK